MLEFTETTKAFTGLTALTLVFLAAGIVLIATNRTASRQARNAFLASVIAIMIIAIIDWFTYITSGQYPELRWLHTILMAVTFALAPVIPAAIANIIYPEQGARWVLVLLGVHAAFQVVSIFGGLVFWIDENNVYHRGPLYVVYMAAYTLSALYLVIESVRAGRTYQTTSVAGPIAILIAMALGVSIQIINPDIRTTWPAVGSAVMLYFMFYVDMILRADALTKLLNRRSYEEFLAKPTLPCVVIVVDVDDFKLANDTYGHAFGDVCLMRIAAMLKRIFGTVGTCYRTGGDEFVVIMTKRIDEVESFVAEVQAAVDTVRANDKKQPSVSLGYAVADANCKDFQAVIHTADQAMYDVKSVKKVGR